MQFFRHFLLLPYKIGVKELTFISQSSANLSRKTILKQNFVICRLTYKFTKKSRSDLLHSPLKYHVYCKRLNTCKFCTCV